VSFNVSWELIAELIFRGPERRADVGEEVDVVDPCGVLLHGHYLRGKVGISPSAIAGTDHPPTGAAIVMRLTAGSIEISLGGLRNARQFIGLTP
jgi:hypothetical protein